MQNKSHLITGFIFQIIGQQNTNKTIQENNQTMHHDIHKNKYNISFETYSAIPTLVTYPISGT